MATCRVTALYSELIRSVYIIHESSGKGKQQAVALNINKTSIGEEQPRVVFAVFCAQRKTELT